MFPDAAGRVVGRRPTPLWQRAALLSLGFFLCAWLGRLISDGGGTAVNFWLPGGLFVAVLLVNPTRDWPWLMLAIIPANVLFDVLHDPDPNGWVIAYFCAANMIQAGAGAWLVRRLVVAEPTLASLKEFFWLLFFAGIVGSALGATMGTTMLTSFQLTTGFWATWRVLWGGNVMAVLVLSPFILKWFSSEAVAHFRRPSGARALEALALGGGMLLFLWWVLVRGGGINSPKIPVLVFILWAGLRFRVRGAAAAVFLLAIASAFFTSHFKQGLTAADLLTGDYAFTLQIFVAVAVMVGLVPAIVIEERDRTLRSLRESDEKFSKAFYSSPDAISISDLATGEFIEVNEGFPKIYGYTREEIIGRTSQDLGMWEIAGDRAELVRRLTADRAVRNQANIGRKRSGELFHNLFSAEIVEIKGRVCLISVVHDMTAQKRAEALMTAQMRVLEMIAAGKPMKETLEALLRLMETQSPDTLCSILLLDADGVHVRHGAAPSLPAEFIRAVDGTRIGPCVGSCGTAAFRREPVLVADIANDPLWADYKNLALPHGLRACWSTPIFDAQQNVLGTFAIYRRTPGLPDAAHRQLTEMATHTAAICLGKDRAEQSRRENELRLRLMAELIAGYSFSYTVSDGSKLRLEWLSQGGEKVLGYTEAELKGGVSFRDQIHPDDQADQQAMLATVLSGTPEIMEFRFRVKVGGFRWLRCFNRPEKDSRSGQVIRILGAGQDITDLKLAEQEQAEAVAREQQARINYTFQLIASQEAERKRIAAELHDSMGQNLLLIKNLAQIASRAQEPSQVYEQVNTISHLAQQCINEARQISRDLHPHQLDHLGLKRSLELMLENAAAASPAKFFWKIEDAEEIFSADAKMNLYRIVQESLNNILKHSRAQNVRVQLERDVHEVVLEITDDGCGFEPAAQLHSKSGMGLKNVIERVRMLGGKLTLDSTPGTGTRITATIPVASEVA